MLCFYYVILLLFLLNQPCEISFSTDIRINDVVKNIPTIIENINDLIPYPNSPVIVKTKYLEIIENIDILNNLSVLFMACIAADNAGCMYIIKKNGPIKYI